MERKSKSILAIISYPFLPATTGGEISTLQILTYLSHVHDVTVFTVEPYQQSYDIGTAKFKLIFGMPFRASRYWNLRLIPRIRSLIGSVNAEWLFFDQPWLGWMIWILQLTGLKPKVCIRSNNLEYLRFKSMGKWYWQMLYIYEKWTYRAADLLLFVNDNERQKAIYEFDLDPDKTHYTPYGISSNELPESMNAATKDHIRKELGIVAEDIVILYFATLSYFPNYEAVDFIASEVYPRLKQRSECSFKIIICGKGLPQSYRDRLVHKPEIIYTGFVADINRYIDFADIMINPILSGGGVKTKAIDTLARNQRVVSTVTGAEGIEKSVCGNCLLVCNDGNWDEFADTIITNARLPKQLPNEFFYTYSWEEIIKRLTQRL